MAMLDQVSSDLTRVKMEAAEKTSSLSQTMDRQRRKSREMEQAVFGMNLTDVEKLRKIFNAIDEDGSGSIDADELRIALHKAGKFEATKGLVVRIMRKYDLDGNGTLEFNEYQLMIKDWDTVLAEIEDDKNRLAAALAAAESPIKTGSRSNRSSKELSSPCSSNQSSKRGSRRPSRDTLLEDCLDLAKKPEVSSRPFADQITPEEREDIARKLSARGGRRRRSM